MPLPLLAIAFLALLTAAYCLYGGWVAQQFALDAARPRPRTRSTTGVDFVPTRPFYLFAQHFSAIAAAGPIAGPILAAQTFGWLPCLLWIGARRRPHRRGARLLEPRRLACATARARSPRSRASTSGRAPARAMMAFIWIALVYVIVAFVDITAASFVAGTEELRRARRSLQPGRRGGRGERALPGARGGAWASCSASCKPPLWLVTVIFVPATFALSWLGTHSVDLLRLRRRRPWALLILAYCCVASMVPVWALLQPRGYLGGFVLYAALALGVIGIFFGGYEIEQPAFKGFDAGGMTGTLFPFLFVTIACGACSGFHGLVCSGTTSKQIDARVAHARRRLRRACWPRASSR